MGVLGRLRTWFNEMMLHAAEYPIMTYDLDVLDDDELKDKDLEWYSRLKRTMLVRFNENDGFLEMPVYRGSVGVVMDVKSIDDDGEPSSFIIDIDVRVGSIQSRCSALASYFRNKLDVIEEEEAMALCIGALKVLPGDLLESLEPLKITDVVDNSWLDVPEGSVFFITDVEKYVLSSSVQGPGRGAVNEELRIACLVNGRPCCLDIHVAALEKNFRVLSKLEDCPQVEPE